MQISSIVQETSFGNKHDCHAYTTLQPEVELAPELDLEAEVELELDLEPVQVQHQPENSPMASQTHAHLKPLATMTFSILTPTHTGSSSVTCGEMPMSWSAQLVWCGTITPKHAHRHTFKSEQHPPTKLTLNEHSSHIYRMLRKPSCPSNHAMLGWITLTLYVQEPILLFFYTLTLT